eukprot:1608438-Rhodomonas_salina.2
MNRTSGADDAAPAAARGGWREAEGLRVLTKRRHPSEIAQSVFNDAWLSSSSMRGRPGARS